MRFQAMMLAATGVEKATQIVGYLCYLALALVAAWGVYCLVMVWLRIGQRSFRSDDEQTAWLQQVLPQVRSGDFAAVEALLGRDVRAVPQLVRFAVSQKDQELPEVKRLVVERFQRSVVSDLDYRLSWVHTMIKAAPMLGLHGTVMGMMGAFGKLAVQESVRPDALAQDISLALITTAIGLTTAIPLMIAANTVNIRIQRLQESVEAALRSVFHAWEQFSPQPWSKAFK